MPKNRRIEFPDFDKMGKDLEDFLNALPNLSAVAAINFFQDRFDQGGWIDDKGFEKWQNNNNNTKTLLKTSNLKDSFDYSYGKDWLEVINFAPYSKIHNEGGILTIKITKRSRKYFWYIFKRTGDVKWKYMAMKKESFMQVKIPKRQHIGHSQFLMKRLEKAYFKQIEKLTKKHL